MVSREEVVLADAGSNRTGETLMSVVKTYRFVVRILDREVTVDVLGLNRDDAALDVPAAVYDVLGTSKNFDKLRIIEG